MLTGENHLQDLQDLITAALGFYGKRQELDNTPISQVHIESISLTSQNQELVTLLCFSLCNQKVEMASRSYIELLEVNEFFLPLSR